MYKKIITLAMFASSAFFSAHAVAQFNFKLAPFSIGTMTQQQIAFDDLDSDGNLDALLSYDGTVHTLVDKTSYKLKSRSEFIGRPGQGEFLLLDLNGDGHKDILSSAFVIFLNDGNGHFGSESMNSSVNRPTYETDHIQSIDLDSNGIPDIVRIDIRRQEYSQVEVFMNVRHEVIYRQGNFQYEYKLDLARQDFRFDGQQPFENTVGMISRDLNGDNFNDLIILNGAARTNLSTQSRVLLSDQKGGFIASQSISNAEDIALGDFNGDGHIDAFLARTSLGNQDYQADEIWLNDGAGYLNKSDLSLGQGQSRFARAADFDLDGDLDLLVLHENSGVKTPSHPIPPQAASLWINNGSAEFIASTFEFGANKIAYDLDVVDVDQDGDLDIVTRNVSADYDLNYVSTNKIKLNQNEIWLNQLIPNDVPSELGSYQAGINFCQENPDGCGLFPYQEIENAYLLGLDDGINSCALDPASCDLFDTSHLESDRLAAYQEGYNEGLALGDQTGYERGYSDGLSQGMSEGFSKGLTEGLAEGLLEGYATGYDVGFIKGSEQRGQEESEAAYDEGYDEGLAEGQEAGVATCQDNPSSCGLFDESEFDAYSSNVIAQIIATLPRGILVSQCKHYPESPLCGSAASNNLAAKNGKKDRKDKDKDKDKKEKGKKDKA